MGKPEILLFTDGSCPRNPGPGGWAYILRIKNSGTEKQDSGGEIQTTNNRMELQAAIEPLRLLKSKPCSIVLCSDSQYVTKGISEWMQKWKRLGWKKLNAETMQYEPILNVDLWKEIDELIKPHDITMNWVKGHKGHPENERCDEMAGLATQRIMQSMTETAILK